MASTNPAKNSAESIPFNRAPEPKKRPGGDGKEGLCPSIPAFSFLRAIFARFQIELKVLFLDFAGGEDFARLELELLLALLPLFGLFLNLLSHTVPPSSLVRARGVSCDVVSRRSVPDQRC